MTHEDAIKNLMELQIRLINDNSKEAIEYNKKIYDTLAYFITQTIPLSVIEDIKAEIDKHKLPCCFKDDRGYTHFLPNVIKVDDVLEIIDHKIKEIKNECRACKHSDELDGEYCYECVKGNEDNFERR